MNAFTVLHVLFRSSQSREMRNLVTCISYVMRMYITLDRNDMPISVSKMKNFKYTHRKLPGTLIAAF